MNSWGENDICTVCGAHAERMSYHRPWQYYASSGILLAAAVFFVVEESLDLVVRALIFFVVLVAAMAVSNWGMKDTKRRVLQEVAKRKAAEGKT